MSAQVSPEDLSLYGPASNFPMQKLEAFCRDHLSSNGESAGFPEVPKATYDAFRASGLANWWLPQEVGGQGVSLVDSVPIVERMCHAEAGFGFSFFISILGSTAISVFGTPEQQQRFLRPLAEKGGYCATASTEHGAGSELMRIATTAKLSGGQYSISGRKSYCTNAAFAEWVLVICRTEGDSMPFRAIVVPKGTPGMTMRKRWPMIGVRNSSTYEIDFEDCRVPAENALPAHGLVAVLTGLNASRLLIGVAALGISTRIRDLSMHYADSKVVGTGKPLHDNDVFIAKVADMEMGIDTMRAVCNWAALDFDAGGSLQERAGRFASMPALKSAITAKTVCGDIGWQIATAGSTMFGGLGYTNEHAIEKLVRDVRFVSIVEAGDDIIRDSIYKYHVRPHYLTRVKPSMVA